MDIALADAAEQMRRWHGVSADQIEKRREMYDADWAEYDKAIGRAIRAGQFEHPLVREWISERRSLGERTALRKYRLGLERGVKKGMSKEDFFVAFEAGGFIQKKYKVDEGRRNPEAIRRSIINKLLISKPEHWFDLSDSEIEKLRARLKDMPRQNFHRLLRRLHVL